MRPKRGRFYGSFERNSLLFSVGKRNALTFHGGYLFSLAREYDFYNALTKTAPLSFEVNVDNKFRGRIIVAERRVSIVVDNLGAGLVYYVYASENTRHTPHILVLEIASAAVTVNCYGEFVFALAHIFRNIVFLRTERILAETYVIAVDVYFGKAVDAVKTQEYVAFGLLDVKLSYVAAYRIVFFLYLRHSEKIVLY